MTAADPVPGRGAGLSEVRVLHPVLGADLAAGPGLRVQALLNLERWTLAGGELAVGAWGEGFVDRRHPHTVVHELMVSWRAGRDRQVRVGAAAGKGFVAFGTDDPMSRPAVRYPVNHHWAQLLERALLLAQAGYGPVTLEATLFNGDEPERPTQGPNLARFGDSWAVRALLAPRAGVEVQVSTARVRSPEHRGGAGPTQRKWSASVRADRHLAGRPAYGLAEWARTEDGGGAFRFHSLLAEGAIGLGLVRPYYRYERTTRPEEERLGPFRSRRPHLEDEILGSSRWTLHTVGAEWDLRLSRRLATSLVAEVTGGRIARSGPGIFQVADWYRRSELWSVNLGFRVGRGMKGHRMGRYGLLGPVEGHHQ